MNYAMPIAFIGSISVMNATQSSFLSFIKMGYRIQSNTRLPWKIDVSTEKCSQQHCKIKD